MSEEAAAADLALVARLTAERDDARARPATALAELEAFRPHLFALARQLGRCEMAFEIILQATNADACHRTARRMRGELAMKARKG